MTMTMTKEDINVTTKQHAPSSNKHVVRAWKERERNITRTYHLGGLERDGVLLRSIVEREGKECREIIWISGMISK